MTPESERPEPNRNEALREEFNRWAEAGRGEGMEEDHLPIVLPVLDQMKLVLDDNVLDVGCGAGWLVRILAARVHEGRVIGMDISDEMVRRARRNYVAVENAMFVIGGVDEIPWDANFFTHAISVESAYYWPDPARGLHEIHRVLREGGSAWILINYYQENSHSHQWAGQFATPAQLLSAEEFMGSDCSRTLGLLLSAIVEFRIPRRRPKPTRDGGSRTPPNFVLFATSVRCYCTGQNDNATTNELWRIHEIELGN